MTVRWPTSMSLDGYVAGRGDAMALDRLPPRDGVVFGPTRFHGGPGERHLEPVDVSLTYRVR